MINIGLLEDEALVPATGCSSTSASPCRRSTRRRPTLALGIAAADGRGLTDELDASDSPSTTSEDGADEVRRRVPRPGGRTRGSSARITELAGDDHFKFMEVCGGHTHTIYRHGIEHVLPEQRRAGARAGLPGVRDPDGPGRRRHRDGRDARRDLHLASAT